MPLSLSDYILCTIKPANTWGFKKYIIGYLFLIFLALALYIIEYLVLILFKLVEVCFMALDLIYHTEYLCILAKQISILILLATVYYTYQLCQVD